MTTRHIRKIINARGRLQKAKFFWCRFNQQQYASSKRGKKDILLTKEDTTA